METSTDDQGVTHRTVDADFMVTPSSQRGTPIDENAQVSPPSSGSTVGGAIFNFTNAVVGAGAIGLGGAFAESGGLVSVVLILAFAFLTKLSLDLVIDLSAADGSYEALGRRACGTAGEVSVLLSKMLYSFGCLVAYVVVVKDNFVAALEHLWFERNNAEYTTAGSLLNYRDSITWILSISVILPLCLLRDMTPLSKFSLISVLSMVLIVVIVIYLYFFYHDDLLPPGEVEHDFMQHWLEVRVGLWESLGTFVFSFVSQHTVHLAYQSLKPELRSYKAWTQVSTYSMAIATTVSLTVGMMDYMTFWNSTRSDLFDMYPSSYASIDYARFLLCVTMLLTFPLPFFTCREMTIVAFQEWVMGPVCCRSRQGINPEPTDDDVTGDAHSVEIGEATNDLTEPLLSPEEEGEDTADDGETQEEHEIRHAQTIFLPDRQLRLPYHVGLTVLLWSAATTLAIVAPNLGSVLDLVGCSTGTVMAFILPGLFSLRIRGYSRLAALILLVGGFVGVLGTGFSLKNLVISGEDEAR